MFQLCNQSDNKKQVMHECKQITSEALNIEDLNIEDLCQYNSPLPVCVYILRLPVSVSHLQSISTLLRNKDERVIFLQRMCYGLIILLYLYNTSISM